MKPTVEVINGKLVAVTELDLQKKLDKDGDERASVEIAAEAKVTVKIDLYEALSEAAKKDVAALDLLLSQLNYKRDS